ncbi:MAG: glycosyl hydrolase 115 family protein [Candidatus Marinimicrobia bacterium]|nr:glycosyl hydrolase 115 family protein [Candidatus Neomarinimicrobiota bacterium]
MNHINNILKRNYFYLRSFKLSRWHILVLLLIFFSVSLSAYSESGKTVESNSYISAEKEEGFFTLSVSGKSAPLCVNSQDYPGVIRVLKHLQTDIGRVTNALPALSIDTIPAAKEIVLVGTLGKSPLIDKLVQNKKLDVEDIAECWETFLIQIVEKPLPNVDRALIIAGSDKRGTIYGIYDLSEKIGVSPWYWWADVPVKKKSNVYVLPGRYTYGEPKVKYRGIFINDEAPALSSWVYEKYGGFNSKFYEHVFELILRLKGNFLWPAMWGRAFYDDDPMNPKLADEYGIVIGTSHHEPMMRAHDEWRRFGSGPWNYEMNEAKLREFWTEGIERMRDYESIVTLAMRGDGDEPMTEKANISLLEKIVKDQREILAEVTGKKVESIPQVWALYKEVQEYYDKGMRVPDDVTLLLCDDNWGNIRKLPKLSDKPRSGGYGIYYHYDYVGGPRNYKWLNTNQISRVWEQMHLAYEYGVDRIWIVNVGDIKPMEFPIEFFLDYAWNPEALPAEKLSEYTEIRAKEQFGAKYAKAIAHIITEYSRYNSRRKPELLEPGIYSVINYREAERVVADYNELYRQAKEIYEALSKDYKDAFYQLVMHPVEACSNLNELYVTVARNRLYAKQGRAATNSLALKARKLYEKDAEITHYYNTILADGKWNHMMDQTHISYTYWQQPEKNSMPKVKKIRIPGKADMGVAIEGSEKWWPNEQGAAILPEFDCYNKQQYYIEIFNRGKKAFEYTVKTGKEWLLIDHSSGKIETEKRLWVSVDWEKIPTGKHTVPITVMGPRKKQVVIEAIVNNPSIAPKDLENRFIESNGYVSIEASHYSKAVNTAPVTWQCIPDLGRTESAMTAFPVTVPAQTPAGDSPRLEYQVYLFSNGDIKVKAYLSPTLNFHNNRGLRYGISFDNETPQIINIHKEKTFQDWEESVKNNITVAVSTHLIKEPGKHVLKFWAVDPGIVLQKLVVDTGNLKPSYLGPPESYFMSGKSE